MVRGLAGATGSLGIDVRELSLTPERASFGRQYRGGFRHPLDFLDGRWALYPESVSLTERMRSGLQKVAMAYSAKHWGYATFATATTAEGT